MDSKLKISILGSCSTLREELFNAYPTENNTEVMGNTVGVNFKIFSYYYNSTLYRIQLWDIDTSNKFKIINRAYLRDNNSCIIIFQNNLDISIDELKDYLGNDTLIFYINYNPENSDNIDNIDSNFYWEVKNMHDIANILKKIFKKTINMSNNLFVDIDLNEDENVYLLQNKNKSYDNCLKLKKKIVVLLKKYICIC